MNFQSYRTYRYLTESSPATLGKSSKTAFEWSCSGPEIDAKYVHTMRCNSALDQAVPFPTNWKTAIPFVLKVKKLCQAATTDAKRKAKNFSITCELMGLPLDSDRLDALCGKEAGSLVSLPELDTEMP